MPNITSINSMQDQIIEDFSFFDDWADKYKYLISLGSDMPEFPKDKMIEKYFVRGCQSQVWFYSQLQEDGKLKLYGTSDAAIVKGLMALLLKVFDLQKPEDIIKADLIFIEKIGLNNHLSVTRSNGLFHMVKALRKSAADAVVRLSS